MRDTMPGAQHMLSIILERAPSFMNRGYRPLEEDYGGFPCGGSFPAFMGIKVTLNLVKHHSLLGKQQASILVCLGLKVSSKLRLQTFS